VPRPVLGVDHDVKARHDRVLHIGIAERARHAGSITAAGARTGAFPWAVLVGLAHPMGVIAIRTLGHHRLSPVAAPEYLRLPAQHHNLIRMLRDCDGVGSAGGLKIVQASKHLLARACLGEHFNAVAQILNPVRHGTPMPASRVYINPMVARKKPSEPAEHRWQISFIKATPVYLGDVYARDEATAIEEAAREFKIDDTLKNRLVARREA